MKRKLHILILESHGKRRESLVYRDVELEPGENLAIYQEKKDSVEITARVENIDKKGDG